MNEYLIGNKESFAIEVKDYEKNKFIAKVRFWMLGEPYGDLRKQDDITDVIDGLKMLVSQKGILYEDAFEKMTDEQIFSHCLLLEKDTNHLTAEDQEFVKKVISTYGIWFGEQFDNVTHITYYKKGNYHFLWSYNRVFNGYAKDFLKNFKHASVNEHDFEKAVNVFLSNFDK